MSDQQPAPAKPETAQAPAEWKPEPRQWGWKDLFTAPMLAFKPKCMLVSAATLVLLGLLLRAFVALEIAPGDGWYWPVWSAFLLAGLAIFGLGATLVAVFMKADLLDDEFLSFGEALSQFKGRALAAVLVPVFLAALVAVAHGLLIWLPMFASSAPYAGGLVYGLLYPLAFFAAIFCILLFIAALFSMFVFPAIVAVRRHGWFDNVVDTIEAVGTRPHVLVASMFLTGIFMVVAYGISMTADRYLREVAIVQPAWGSETGRSEPARVEDRGQEISRRALSWLINPVDPVYVGMRVAGMQPVDTRQPEASGFFTPRQESEFFHRWFSGMAAGFWQTVIGAFILGYCLNLFIGGGMLTYLVVREDDYWDDEDLEDLDKLAKELEEEAKREEAGQAPAAAAAAPAAPATAPAPVLPSEPKPPAGETLPTQIIPPKG